jgi:hypothetical protein
MDAARTFTPRYVAPAEDLESPATSTPERRLMIAVLQSAVECLEKHRFATDSRARRLFEEAQVWLHSDETEWPCSFEHICDVLELNASAVRRRLDPQG